MTYARIFVTLDLGPTASDRVRMASNLAERFEATLVGIAAREARVRVRGLRYDPALSHCADEQASSELRDAEALFRRAVPATSTVAWLSAVAEPLDHLLRRCRAADLVVVGRRGLDEDAIDAFGFSPGALVMEAGRPILVVPPGVERIDPERILVAWDDTRESRRAIVDALPFMRSAAETVVVALGPEAERKGVEEVAAFLVRHGVRASSRAVPRIRVRVSEDLIDLSDGIGAGMIVMGAYGHSRLREWTLGGVTADLLASTPLSCLMSH